jgi:Rod binding domain-containing protein
MGLHAVSTGAGTRLTQATDRNDPKKIHDAATQFESLMIEEMLKTVRASTDDDALSGDDDGDSSGGLALDMAQGFFAQAIAAKGGLGLADTIAHGVETEAARVQERDQKVSTKE